MSDESKMPLTTGAHDRTVRYFQTAAAIAAASTSLLNLEELLPRTVALIREGLALDFVGVFMASGPWATLSVGCDATGATHTGYRLAVDDSTMVGLCLRTAQPQTAAAPAVPVYPSLPHVGAEMALPLMSRGLIMGAISLHSSTLQKFDADDVLAAQVIVGQLANAITNARLLEETQRALVEAEVLYRASQRITTALTLDDLLVALVEEVNVIAVNRVSLWALELDDEGQAMAMVLLSAWNDGTGAPSMPLGTRMRFDQMPALQQVGRSPLFVENVNADSRIDPLTLQFLQQLQVAAFAALPLTVSSRLVGTLLLMCYQAYRFTEYEMRLYVALSQQVAMTLENRRLLERTKAALTETEVLYRAGLAINEAQSVEDIVLAVAEIAAFVRMDSVSLHVFTTWNAQGDPLLVDTYGMQLNDSAREVQYAPNMPFDAAQQDWYQEGSRRVTVVRDVQDSSQELPERVRANLLRRGYRSMITTTLVARSRRLGRMTFYGNAPFVSAPDYSVQALVRALADQTAIALDNRLLLAEVASRAERLATASQISQFASSILNLHDLLHQVVELIQERFALYYVGIFLVDRSAGVVVLRAGSGDVGTRMLDQGYKVALGNASLIGRCVTAGQVEIGMADDAGSQWNAPPLLPHSRFEMVLPLVSRNQIIGAMDIHSEKAAAFSPSDISILHTMGDQLANIIQNAEFYEQSQQALSETEALYRTTQMLGRAQNISEILDGVLEMGKFLALSGFEVQVVVDRDAKRRPRTLDAHGVRLSAVGYWDRYLDTGRSVDEIMVALADSPKQLLTCTEVNDPIQLFPEHLRQMLVQRNEKGGLLTGLVARGGVVGFFFLSFREPLAAVVHHNRYVIARTVADQIAVTLDNLLLAENTRLRAEQLERASEVEKLLSQADVEEDILAAIMPAVEEARAVHGELLYIDEIAEGVGYAYATAVWDGGTIQPDDGRLLRKINLGELPFYPLWVRAAHEVLSISDITSDECVDEELRGLAACYDFRALAVIPLWMGIRWQGVIMLSWPQPHTFSPQELFVYQRLLSSAASIVARRRAYLAEETARMENERRALQLEKLARLQSAFSQAKDEMEIITVLAEVMAVGRQCRIFLLYADGERSGHSIAAHAAAVWPADSLRPGEPLLEETVPLAETPLALFIHDDSHHLLFVADVTADAMVPEDLCELFLQRATRSLVAIPLYYSGRLLGVVALTWDETRIFTDEERFILNRLQEPLSAVLAVRLTSQSQERSARESEQRFWQLQTASEVSRYASSTLDLDELLPRAVELIKERFNLYYVGIFLVDDSNRWAVLRAGTGEAGRVMLERGHKFTIGGESMIGQCVALGEPQLPKVIEAAEVRYANPLLPETRSEIALPLTSGGEVLGAMTIQSTIPNHFKEEDIIVLGTMTDQLANAIANARFFVESKRRMDEMQRLQQRYTLESWLGYADQESTYGVRYDLNHVELLDTPPDSRVFTPTYWTEGDVLIRQSGPVQESGIEAAIKMRGEPVGLLSLYAPQEAREWSQDDVDVLKAVRDQVELTLENRLLFERSQRALAATQQRESQVRFLQEVAAFLNATDDIVRSQKALLARLQTFIASIVALEITSYDTTTGKLRLLEAPEQDAAESSEWVGSDMASSSGAMAVIRDQQMCVDDDIRHRRRFWEDGQLIEAGIISRIIMPLQLGARVLGTLGLSSCEEAAFSQPGVLTVLSQVTAQIASAMERAHLFGRTRAALDESRALYEASNTLAQAVSYDAVLSGIMQHTLLSGSAWATMGLFTADPGTGAKNEILQIVSRWSNAPQANLPEIGARIAAAEMPALRALVYQEIFVCEDMNITNSLLGREREVYLQEGVQGLIVVPLKASGERIGLLQVMFSAPHALSELESRLYRITADQAAVVLRNLQLLDESRARAEQLSAAVRLANVTTSIMERDTLFNTSVSFLQEQFDLYHVGLFILDDVGQWAELRAGTGLAGKQMLRMGFRLQNGGNSLVGLCIESSRPRYSLDVTHIPDYEANPLLPETRAELALPLISRGQVLGAVSIQSQERFAFTEEGISTLELMVNQLANVIESLNLYERSQKTLAETTALYRVVQRVSDARTPQDVFRVVIEGISQREEADLVVAGRLVPPERPHTLFIEQVWDRDNREFPARAIPLTRIPRLYDALRVQNRFASPDCTQDPLVDNYAREIYRQVQVRGMAAFQLDIRGLQYGVIMVHSRKAREFSTPESRFYENVARQAFVALESFNSVDTMRAEAERRAILNEVLQTASSALNPITLLRDVGEVLARRLQMLVVMWRWDGENAAIVAAYNLEGKLIAENVAAQQSALSRTLLVDAVIRTREALHISSMNEKDQRAFSLALGSEFAAEEVFVVPLMVRNLVMGVMLVARDATQPIIADDRRDFIKNAALNIGVALETARLYIEAQETAEKLKEVDQLKSEFLANMSHELRTPLNSIIGFSRVILKGIDGPLTDMQKTDLSAIYDSGQHLLNLINDILDISKIEAGKMEFNYEPTDLKDIFRGVLSTAIALVKDKHIELKTDVPDDLPLVMADSRRVRQVVLNLVSNAAKFTDDGSITVGAVYDDYQVIVSVRDTGIGIPADKVDAVFEQFKQVDSSSTRKYGGTGLGVPLSKKFVEQHGGDMWLSSQVGEGTTFYFNLPIGGPPPKKPDEPTSAQQPSAMSPYRTVLAIDDDPSVITLFRRYLEHQFYHVFGLTQSERAVAEAQHLKPYAIILDIMMPGKDGWTVIQELKSNSETRNIPIIVCSIVGDPGRGLSMGVSDYLLKPIAETDIVNALQRLERMPTEGRVLLVDDNADDRTLLRRILESAGYVVSEADGGKAAIAQIHTDAPNLVVLDLMMPDVDGFAVLESLKGSELTREIPVIVVTAKELSGDERSRLQQGVQALLQKGIFDQQQLLLDVATALKRLGNR